MSDLSVDVLVIRRSPAEGMLDDSEIASLVEHALTTEGATGAWEISIVLVDDAELQALHHEFMGIDEPTDVMTFPADADEDRGAGGDIVISVDRAAEQGPEHGSTAEEEVRFLIAHGVLHLCGWDDHDPADRAAMLDRQTAILASISGQTG